MGSDLQIVDVGSSIFQLGHDEKHYSDPLMSRDNPSQYEDWLRVGWHPRENSNKMGRGSGSDDKSARTETVTDDVYTRATFYQPILSKGIGGTKATGGKLTLESESQPQTKNNDATLVLQAAEDQSGWDRPRDVKRNLRESGESRDQPTSSFSGSSRSPKRGQLDALSTAGLSKQLSDEAHEATSPLEPKIKASPLGNTAQPAPEPVSISGPTRKVKLKKVAREICNTQAHDVEMSTLCAEVGSKRPCNLESLEKEVSSVVASPQPLAGYIFHDLLFVS
nr:hypothetical protein CFP56_33865 [Quercus suber]